MNIELDHLTVRFGSTAAVDDVSLRLPAGRLYGLLGRNAAGKTTLLSMLAGFRRPTAGRVRIDGEDPFENAYLAERTSFARDNIDAQDGERVRNVFAMARALRPNWDQDYAEKLIDLFQIPVSSRIPGLSRGQRSGVSIAIAMASRSPLTILDEPYLGLDAPTRYAFYDELLADYAARRHTVILSSHLVEEVAPLFEHVIILDRGRLVLYEDADTLRSRGAAVTGPAPAVDQFLASPDALGLVRLNERQLGPTKSTTIYGQLGPTQIEAAQRLGLEVGAVGLQDLFVYLTKPGERSNDRDE